MNQSKREKPLPPMFMTREVLEAYENGTEEEFIELFQPQIRYICTRLNCWRHCRLPRCRRSRCCTGSHKPRTFHPTFPPCISSNELHQAWLLEHRVYIGEVEAAYADAGDEKGA
jgi:hypothetical protein